MVTYIDDKTIEREAPAFRQNLALLNQRTQKAGISLIFDADRAMQRDDEGFDHRYEIYAAIIRAKGPDVPDKAEAKGAVNVVNFMRQIATLTAIMLVQENGTQKVAAANAPEIFDDIKILGDAQDLLRISGSKMQIDYNLVRGQGAEAGGYRVQLADAVERCFRSDGDGTRPHEVSDHPVYDSYDELLALAKNVTNYCREPGQGSIL